MLYINILESYYTLNICKKLFLPKKILIKIIYKQMLFLILNFLNIILVTILNKL